MTEKGRTEKARAEKCGNPSCEDEPGDRAKNGLCERCDGQRSIVAAILYSLRSLGSGGGSADAPSVRYYRPDPAAARRDAEVLIVELDKPWGAP